MRTCGSSEVLRASTWLVEPAVARRRDCRARIDDRDEEDERLDRLHRCAFRGRSARQRLVPFPDQHERLIGP